MATFSISATARKAQATGTGAAGPFSFAFQVNAQSELAVYVDNTLKTLTTHYTVTLNADGTGSITFTSGNFPTTSQTVTILGNAPLSRTSVYTSGGNITATALETDFDTNVMVQQQQQELLDRTMIAPVSDPSSINMTLPNKADRADKLLKFDTEGNPEAALASSVFANTVVGANFVNNVFTGNGSTTAYPLTVAPGSKNNCQVFIDGVYQEKSTFSINASTLTFTEAPPLNASIEVIIGNALDSFASDASAINYDQGGTGYVGRTVESRLRDFVSVKDFGAVGGAVVDDTAAIQAAVDYCTANQKKLFLDGAFKITSPIEINYANITIEGNLHGFGSIIYPHNCAAFKIDGTDKSGGYSFNVTLKDFTISGNNVSTAQDYCILLKNAYRCLFSNLRITQVPVDTSSGFSTVIKTEGTNLVNHFDRVFINGAGNTGSGRIFSIESNEASTIFMTQCDAENAFQGVYVAANSRVEMISPYLERCGTSIFIEAGTGTPDQTPHINIYGGTIDLPSSSSIGVNFNGTFSRNEIINIDGLRFSSGDHATKNKGFVTSAMTWSNDNKINITNVDWSWIDKPSGLYHSAYIKPLNPYEEDLLDIKRYTFKITSLADNTATDVFKIDSLPTADPYEPVFVRVRVWESFNGYGRALEESVFVIQDRFDTNSYVSTKQVVAAVQETDAANYSITTLEMSTTENSDNIVFKVTSDFNTALVSTMPEVYFDVEIIGTGKFTLL